MRAQRLTGEPFPSALSAVRWFGAVQAQDYGAAKWGVGQRTAGVSDAELNRLFDAGLILRTHVLRPTWHFVLPEDVRWLQELTAARVLAGMAGRFRQLELDRPTIDRAVELLGEALAGGNQLTRPEIGSLLAGAGISPEGQRLAHLLAAAEHGNVITSGQRRGAQFTYALLSERAPGAPSLDRDEALAELTRRYFRSHGPAQDVDMSWWSGLPLADVRRGIQLAGADVESGVVEGKRYWLGEAEAAAGPLAHLLPNFDELSVGYRDRSALLDPRFLFDGARFSWFRESAPESAVLSNILVIGGLVRGSWRRIRAGAGSRLELRLLAPLASDEQAAVETAVDRYSKFLGPSGVQTSVKYS